MTSSADPSSPGSAAPGQAERPNDATDLRPPAHQVSTRATGYWMTSAFIGWVVFLVICSVAVWLIPADLSWAPPVIGVVAVLAVALTVFGAIFKFRTHRWEVTDTAVYTRSGWINVEERVAPLSRVQTVDTQRGALMRAFGLASVTVTTASAAGAISIDCLDGDVADEVTAHLVRITGADEGDAT